MTLQKSRLTLSKQRESSPQITVWPWTDTVIISRVPLLTNAALAALKCTPPSPSLAIKLTTRALTVTDLTPAEKGKALYRRGLGRIAVKDDEEALKDLKAALELVPGDAGIVRSLKEVETRQKARKEKERKAYGKMFG
jgi:peptidyl-prolyl isomerase D